MKILLSYPGHRFSTFDVAYGYEKALKALGHEVHIFDYHVRIHHWAESLLLREEKMSKERRRAHPLATQGKISLLASEGLITEALFIVPDVVLIVNGLSLHRRAYDGLRQLSIPVVLLLTESPYADHIQAVVATKGHAEALLTNDKNSVLPLREATGLPVEYLPHSYDPAIHKPRPDMSDRREYKSDVFFHGTLWPDRIEILQSLEPLADDYVIRLSGVEAAGNEPPDPDLLMPNEELALFYNATRIAINHHRTAIGDDGNGNLQVIQPGQAYSLGPRAYEISACGAFQLCDDTRPELSEVFGDTIATYANGSLVDKTEYYLKNDGERLEMAEAARKRVEPCTFENRAREIVIPMMEAI